MTGRTGSCQCGQVTYRVSGAPVFTYACHCHTCQKRTGSAFAMGTVYLEDALEVSGTMTEFTRVSDAGDTNTRFSCAECGNVIYGIGSGTPGTIKLQPGTLDDTSDVIPTVHIWTKYAQPWVVIPQDAKRYDTQPDSLAELLES